MEGQTKEEWIGVEKQVQTQFELCKEYFGREECRVRVLEDNI